LNEDSVYLCLEKFPRSGNPPAELFAAFTERAAQRLKTLRINALLSTLFELAYSTRK
jgi:hypothetical protein